MEVTQPIRWRAVSRQRFPHQHRPRSRYLLCLCRLVRHGNDWDL
jgi:hypothetical protein